MLQQAAGGRGHYVLYGHPEQVVTDTGSTAGDAPHGRLRVRARHDPGMDVHGGSGYCGLRGEAEGAALQDHVCSLRSAFISITRPCM